ncbi:MAG TPA: choice-of-anchor Q domain-containing protein [Chitinophagaceae bacterium]|nr:choice-of-anchor Q domain-containing protein [Chitinophagaceae bacterium]
MNKRIGIKNIAVGLVSMFFLLLSANAQKAKQKYPVIKKTIITEPKVILKPVKTDPLKTTTQPEQADTSKNIIYVKWDATGSDNGTSWINAYSMLQDALAAAIAGKTIWVAKGTYKPTTTLDRTASFKLKNNVSIYGGFAGIETNLAQRNVSLNPTILDGDIGMIGNFRDNSYNLIYAKGLSSATIINGLIIQNANADRVTQIRPGSSGGGIYIEGSAAGTNVVFKHCHVKDNRATWGGGVVITCTQVRDPDNGGGNPVFDSCTFTNNNGNNMGGAAFIDSYWQVFHPRFTACTFESNNSAEGGAIYHKVIMANSSPLYENCLFVGNKAGSRGAAVSQIFGSSDFGGMTLGQAAPVYTKCIFRNNRNEFSASPSTIFTNTYGRSYTVEIKDCIFEGRITTDVTSSVTALHNNSLQGGSLYLKISNSIFNRLHFGGNGGVINNFSKGGTSIVTDFTNCLFSENYGCNGGVLYAATADPGSRNTTNFYNSIFYNNYFQQNAGNNGCGRGEDIYLATEATAANLVNCLTNKSDCDVMKYGAGNMACTSMIYAADPMFTSFETNNFIPVAASPLIDAGNDTYVSGIGRDYSGNIRRQGARTDIGPYEVR